MKKLNTYKNESFNSKSLTSYITEYIIKKKLDKPIDSEDHYEYYPETKQELIDNVKELFNKGETDLNCIDTSKITDMSRLFESYDISKWNVSNVEDMSYMFFGCKLFDCNLSDWNVSNVENMYCMFGGCHKFKGKGLENWNVGNVTNMSYMFYYCENFDCDLSDWNVNKVKNMNYAFDDCTSLKNKPSWYEE